MKVLALDIGGTNFRIATVDITGKIKILKKKNYYSSQVNDVAKIINSFDSSVDTCVIGFAGPIIGNKAKLTNANLSINLTELKKKTKLKKIKLLNDFHAIGYAFSLLKRKDFMVLNKGKNMKQDVSMVVGPGTGLGKSYIIDGKVHPCEGGFTTLGIENIDLKTSFFTISGNSLKSVQIVSRINDRFGIELLPTAIFEYLTIENIAKEVEKNLRKEKRHGRRTWSFGAYNVYNRKNPFFIRFSHDENGDRALYQYSLFPIIPSVSYRFDF